jgi:hypothetical protein
VNCTDVENLAALAAGGDLMPHELRVLKSHLAECAGCAMRAARLQESQALLRGLADEPFEPAALDVIRRGVFAKIQGPTAVTVPIWRWAFGGATLLFTAGLLWVHFSPRPGYLRRLPASAPPANVEQARQMAPRPAPDTRVTAQHRRARRPRAAKPVITASRQPLLVKFLTDDPDVVVYWIVEEVQAGESR